jgi:O-methyltransferase
MFYADFKKFNRAEFQQLLRRLHEMFGRMYAADNLIALTRTAGFQIDERFQAAFQPHAQNRQEKSLGWRLHTLTWAADHCLGVPGDFVECGVYRGFSMAVVADYVGFEKLDRKLYLYDTFEGIPEAYNSERRSNSVYQEQIAGDKDAIYKHVKDVFAKYPNARIVKGTVPDSFREACPEAISFLHIDMNSTKSEIAALEVLFDRVAPGGMVVFDDYGWSAYVRQKIAEDAYMRSRGHQILELPTGQGLLIKRPRA